MSSNSGLKWIILALVVAGAIGLLALEIMYRDAGGPVIPVEHGRNLFLDVDGDGDLDYVLSIEFVRDGPGPAGPTPPVEWPEIEDPERSGPGLELPGWPDADPIMSPW